MGAELRKDKDRVERVDETATTSLSFEDKAKLEGVAVPAQNAMIACKLLTIEWVFFLFFALKSLNCEWRQRKRKIQRDVLLGECGWILFDSERKKIKN